MQSRIWEIDFLRGVAIILMVIFHLVVDLHDFYDLPLNYFQGFWYYEGKLSAVLFMLLAGVSTRFNQRIWQHGLRVFGWGMVLSLITFFYNPETYIRFGILHLMGGSLMLFFLMKRFHVFFLFIASLVSIFIGQSLAQIYSDIYYLIPFGVTPATFVSLDYYPLFPWYGIFLWGVIAGRLLYQSKQSLLPHTFEVVGIENMGRHSLLIYLVHQPILLSLLFLLYQVGNLIGR